MKAVYYLIEKRLKQGLHFPDSDFNGLLEPNSNHKSIGKTKSRHITNENQYSTNGVHLSSSQQNSDSTNMTNLTNNQSTNNNGIVKQNSQLLPKRQTYVQLATRSSSQKNADFKSILNNLNNTHANRLSYSQTNTAMSNGNSYKENNQNNSVDDSNSPSPDFIAAAMSPIKIGNSNSNNNGSSAASLRNSRQTNYQVYN